MNIKVGQVVYWLKEINPGVLVEKEGTVKSIIGALVTMEDGTKVNDAYLTATDWVWRRHVIPL
jgi:hypothetical protein